MNIRPSFSNQLFKNTLVDIDQVLLFSSNILPTICSNSFFINMSSILISSQSRPQNVRECSRAAASGKISAGSWLPH